MNKFYLLLTAICISFYANVSGQCNPDPSTTSGISPSSTGVPCANRSAVFSQTFTFVVPGSSVGVQSVTFDSITNLPAGLTYAFDQNPSFYNGGSKGCFIVNGTTTSSAACGQYKMRIYVTINTLLGVMKGTMDSLATAAGITGFDPIYIRVKEAAGICPTVNNNNQIFTADVSCGISAGGAPIVTTSAATGLTQNGAQLNGLVNANGLTTSVSFDWGLTNTYGNTVVGTPTGIVGNTAIGVSALVNGLQPNTTYHFRVNGTNSNNTSNGNDLTFTTLAPPSAGNCNPNATQTTLFEPAASSISCIRQGDPYNEVIYLNFTPVANLINFDSVRIDSLGNLPAGIYAYPDQLDKTYLDTESGCIQISGTTNAPCGQYRYQIYITIWIPGLPAPIKGELYTIAKQYMFENLARVYFHRVTACPAPICPALDSTQTVPYVAALTCSNPGPLTLPSVAAGGSTTFCQGKNVKLSATPGYLDYTWTNGSKDSTTLVNTTGTYNVTVSNGCETASAANGIAVTVNPTPVASFSASGSTLTASTAVASYKWIKDGAVISGATNQSYTITETGNYSVIVTIGGCSDTSAVQTITYVGIDEVKGINSLSLVPNPANSQITVRASVSGSTVREITLHDIVGRVMQTIGVNHVSGSSFEQKIDLSGISNGTYFIQLTTEKGKVTRSFVKN